MKDDEGRSAWIRTCNILQLPASHRDLCDTLCVYGTPSTSSIYACQLHSHARYATVGGLVGASVPWRSNAFHGLPTTLRRFLGEVWRGASSCSQSLHTAKRKSRRWEMSSPLWSDSPPFHQLSSLGLTMPWISGSPPIYWPPHMK